MAGFGNITVSDFPIGWSDDECCTQHNDVELTVECNECGGDLKVSTSIEHDSSYNPFIKITVEHCKDCSKQIRDEGKKEGADEGYSEAYDAGYDQAKKEYERED